MPDETRSYRTKRGKRRHALPRDGGTLTMCRRWTTGLLLDSAMPDCKGCLRAIAKAIKMDGDS